MNSTIDQSYDKALDSLRRINNDLFYDELKKNLEKTARKLEKNYETTTSKVTLMDRNVNKLVLDLEQALQTMKVDFVNRSQEVLERTNNEILNSFQKQEAKTEQVLKNFVALQKKLFETYQNLEALQEKQDQSFKGFIDTQRQTLEESTHSINELLIKMLDQQGLASKRYIEEFSEVYTRAVAEFEKAYQQQAATLQKTNQEHQQQMFIKLSDYQKEIVTSFNQVLETAIRQNGEMSQEMKVLESKLTSLEADHTKQFELLFKTIEETKQKDTRWKKGLMWGGIVILTAQILLITLQFV